MDEPRMDALALHAQHMKREGQTAMINRSRPVHSAFESLQAALLSPRLMVRGRPASFATNEQLSALGLSRGMPVPASRFDGPFELR